MRSISLAALTVLELSPVEMVRCAADAGYTHLGIRLLPATANEPAWDIVADTPMRRELVATLAGSGVRTLDVEILRLQPTTDVRHFLAVLEAGAVLGARHVLVAGNDPDEARLTARLAALCLLAAAFDLSIYLEPMPWTDARDFTQAARIVERAAQPNAGVLIDPIHFDRGGNHAAQIAAVPPERLAYLQFCDAPAARPSDLEALLRQARAERLPPGEGGLDLRGILAAAPADAPLSLEVPMLSRGLPALARAQQVLQATRRFLAEAP
ncbi:MAG: sugar phosphate isomerase/epimerase [Burkholderiales bacterium]|nr:sugar phosphate isomerase/epimerase [Burkholderiales bacterium]